MNTRAITTEYRLQHWASIIQEQKASGLSIGAYCEREGFHENKYYYWQKKLRELACEGLVSGTSEKTDLMPSRFTEVKLAGQYTTPTPSMNGSHQLCIEASGIRIIANGGYPADKLVFLMREMRRSC
jgi:hypothetical protein